jgi:hypothetical protein
VDYITIAAHRLRICWPGLAALCRARFQPSQRSTSPTLAG